MKLKKTTKLFGLLIMAGLLISACAPAAEAPAMGRKKLLQRKKK